MDWGLGMFVHWSHDSQLGSVISHSMVGASDEFWTAILTIFRRPLIRADMILMSGWTSPSWQA